MGLRSMLFGSSVKEILKRPIGEGWPTRAELRVGAPSIFVDHTAEGGYKAVFDEWEGYREQLARRVAAAPEQTRPWWLRWKTRVGKKSR